MRRLTWLASGLIGQACAAGSGEPRASGLHRGLPGGKGFALRIQYLGVRAGLKGSASRSFLQESFLWLCIFSR